MKRSVLLSLLLVIALAAPLSAQQPKAVVREFSGKVEVKLPGQDWKAVTLNMVIPTGSMVSTGFSSRLLLEVGLSRLTVKPLTRLRLDELVKKESTNTASLTLKVGKVNAVVKSAEGERTDFTLKGPASTAAVRGTEFDYDGYQLIVTEGIVQFVNLLSQARAVGAGDSSDTDGYSFPASGEEGYSADATLEGTGGGGSGGLGGPSVTGTISVTIN